MQTSRRFYQLLLTSASFAALSACAVGPDWLRPFTDTGTQYDSDATPSKTDSSSGEHGEIQQFVPANTIPYEWWKLYKSEPLDQMITVALKSNPDVASAEAALRVAAEDEAAGEGNLYPTVTGQFATTRQKTSGESYGIAGFPSTIYTLHNAQVDVSYALDLFGGNRRYVEQLEAQRDYQKFNLEGAYITLSANVVTAAVQEASLRDQIVATKSIIGAEEKQLKVLNAQFNLGAVAKTNVLLQEATLAQERATLPPLEQQLVSEQHQLSALMGQLPNHPPEASFTLTTLNLPTELPLTLPSQLVEQRPDIRAAEEALHAASAGIGVAEANRLPQITLSADIGDVATSLTKMFTPGTGIWSAGFNAAQTLFDAGTLEHEQRSAEAQYDQMAATYKKIVIAAFQNVADSLKALQADASTLKQRTAAADAAAQSLDLAQYQFKAGSINYVTLLDAERTNQQAQIARIQAEGQRFADTAALFLALGGGWWNRVPATTGETPDETPTMLKPTNATPLTTPSPEMTETATPPNALILPVTPYTTMPATVPNTGSSIALPAAPSPAPTTAATGTPSTATTTARSPAPTSAPNDSPATVPNSAPQVKPDVTDSAPIRFKIYRGATPHSAGDQI